MPTKCIDIPEIKKIKSIQEILVTNRNIPEQLMINEYRQMQRERKTLADRMNFIRIMKKASKEIVNNLMQEERQMFAKFLCKILTCYRLQQHNIQPFLDDLNATFDTIPASTFNLRMKADTIESMLKNQPLSKEQIDMLSNELRRVEDFIIEDQFMIAGA